jgi:hypothetical protein
MESGKFVFIFCCLIKSLLILFIITMQEEGKEPMSIPLLKLLCKWFLLDQETNDGPFALCILLMTWHLSCHVNNTTIIKL